MEYVGVVYDIITDQIVERSPIIRSTPDAAMRDAKALVQSINADAEARDDSARDDSTVGRVTEDDAFVLENGQVMWDYPTLARVDSHPYGHLRGKF